jgi:hypothetical protein
VTTRTEPEYGLVECILWNGESLAYIVRAAYAPERTAFLTPLEFQQQLGHIVYPAGAEIPRHVHVPLERRIVGTPEVLIVKSGRCLIDIYNDARQLVATRELLPGDIMLMAGGGHGFRMLEDTVLIEVKQGPYTGLEEKERF